MNWDSITVRQAQEIDRVRKSINDEDSLDAETRLLAILLKKSQAEVDSMAWEDYVKARKMLSFFDSEIEGKPSKYINVNGKRYRCVYDVRQMPFARYIEGKTFAQDFMANLHKIAASMVIPQKKRFWYYLDLPYNASQHEEYAKDMLDAPFMTVYQSCVFFYQVFRNWIEVSKDYLIRESMKKGMSLSEAADLVSVLCRSLDGNIPLNKSQTSTISQLQKPTK